MQRLQAIEHEVYQARAQLGIQNQDGGNTQMMMSFNQGGPTGMPSAQHSELIQFNSKLTGMYHDLMKKHADLMVEHQAAIDAKAKAVKAAASGGAAAGGQDPGLAKAASLGVIRLDYDYPPAPGDIDHPGSFGYDVYYRVVPGLTFEICQSGKLTKQVEDNFVEGIKFLVGKGVSLITGDCGFMMYFQQLARRHASIPISMSSLAQLPAVTCGFSKYELIAIMTANGESLRPMRNLIKDECGVDPEERRFIMVGCENVPGFDAVAKGGKVNVNYVTPGIVEIAKKTLLEHPKIRCFLLECTELPPYSDAIRAATGLPVYDAITSCDFFMSGAQDNPLFGINNWQNTWDGKQADYKYGANLTAAAQSQLVNKCQTMPLRPDDCP